MAWSLIFLVISFLIFLGVAFGATLKQVNLLALGLAFYVLRVLVGQV
jgi:hypothetical protein